MLIGREKEQNRERERDKERKKRGNRKYGQAKFKHARKGILSCVISALSAMIILILIAVAYFSRGMLGPIAGSFGLFTVILAGIGVGAGIRGFKERDKNYLTCKIGIGLNTVILLCLITLFVRGSV